MKFLATPLSTYIRLYAWVGDRTCGIVEEVLKAANMRSFCDFVLCDRLNKPYYGYCLSARLSVCSVQKSGVHALEVPKPARV